MKKVFEYQGVGDPLFFSTLRKAYELVEGCVFENKLLNPDDVCYFSRDRMIDDVREYHEAQSRVLSRERCLLLRRVDG